GGWLSAPEPVAVRPGDRKFEPADLGPWFNQANSVEPRVAPSDGIDDRRMGHGATHHCTSAGRRRLRTCACRWPAAGDGGRETTSPKYGDDGHSERGYRRIGRMI